MYQHLSAATPFPSFRSLYVLKVEAEWTRGVEFVRVLSLGMAVHGRLISTPSCRETPSPKKHIPSSQLPSPIHSPLIKLTRPMSALIRKVGQHPIHTNSIFITTKTARHIRPIPLQRHRHLPQILRYVVESLVELRHGVEVGGYIIDVGVGGHGERGLLLEHLRGYAWGAVL